MISIFQVSMLVFIIIMIVATIMKFRKDSSMNAVGWLFFWLSGLIAVIWPKTVSYISNSFGVGRPVDFITYMSILVLFYIANRYNASLDKLNKDLDKIYEEVRKNGP